MSLQHTLLGIIFLLTTTLFAQTDYTLFREDVQYLYSNPLSNSVAGPVLGINVTEECSDTYTTAIDISLLPDFFPDCPGCIFGYAQIPAFAGYKICQTTDTTSLQIEEFRYFTILQQASVGESWLATTQGNTPIYATVDSVCSGNFLSLTDSLKYISLHADSIASAPLTSIIISRSYGLIKGTLFWDVLNFPENVWLIGMSNPVAGRQLPNAHDFFDDPRPQELHLRFDRPRSNSSPDGYEQLVTEMILELTNLTTTTRGIRYDYSGQYVNYVVDIFSLLNPRDTSAVRDTTVSWFFPRHLVSSFAAQPGALVPYPFGFALEEVSSFSDSERSCFGKSRRFNLPVFNNSSTVFDTFSISEISDQIYRRDYYEKIPISFYGAGIEGGYHRNKLQYVKDGDRECGTPLDFSGLTSLATTPLEVDDLRVSPNPTSGHFFINDTEATPETRYQMVDLTGRKVLTVEADGLSTSVNANGIPTGTYFVLKVKAGIVVSKGRVVIQ